MAARKWTSVVLLYFISAAATSSGWRTTEEDGYLNVWDVILEKETDPAHLNYSNFAAVFLVNPKINTFTTEMQSQIKNVADIQLESGVVPTVHVAPQFKEFVVRECSTSNVIINPNLTYATEVLAIIDNTVKKFPKSLNAMKNLKELNLKGNQLEYVDMADFNGLNNLENVYLNENEIIEISSSPVVLPSLSRFDASENRLSYVNFEHWNAIALKSIELHHNRLSIVLALPRVFPSLTFVYLSQNPFYCQWLDATMKELKVRNVRILDEDLTTCNKEEEFRNIMSLKQSIQECKTEIDRLKHMIADLTEALYVHELEVLNDANDQ